MFLSKNRNIAIPFLIALALSGCSTLSISDDPSTQVTNDPFHDINRKIFAFNTAVDETVLKPVAKGYDQVLPEPAKKGVTNFLNNFQEPINVVNNLLQGKFDRALGSTYRFVVNTTLGVAGLIDVASKYEVYETKEDFGQTLAAWGVQPGPYLMLPFFGPSNLRDGVGLFTDSVLIYPSSRVTNSTTQSFGLSVLRVIDTRVSLLGADNLLEQQLDPYTFLKVTYEDSRLNSIYDGNPPLVEEDYDF